jgi:hypothetical protein
MRTFIFGIIVVFSFTALSCEVQSGISKKSVEKYVETPTPEPVAPKEEPIPPDAIVEVDTSIEGPQIPVSDPKARKEIRCDKFNRVSLNFDDGSLKITGGCERIMINGSRNEVLVEGVASIHFNGNENTLRHSKFLNGKRPMLNDNGQGNVLEFTAPNSDE